jgi:putative spermidine/putrescine transport system permease protein
MMIALFILPIAMIFRDSVFGWGLSFENYAILLSDPLYAHVLWNSVRAALQTTAGCVLLGYPAAYFALIAPPERRQLILGTLLFSFAVGTVPRTFSWLVILGDNGLVNHMLASMFGFKGPVQLLYNQFGVFIGMLHVMLPYMVFILYGSMTRVPPTLLPAARSLGARPMTAFLQVFLPLTLPGVVAGAMLVFVYSLGFYLTPAVLGGARETTVVMQIASLTLNSGLWELGAALSSAVIVVSVLGALLYVRVTGLSDVARRD